MKMKHLRFLTILALAGGLLLAACGGAEKSNLPPAEAERAEYEKALSYLARDKTTDAIEALTSLVEDSSNPEVTELATLRLGEALFSDSRYAEAAEVFRQYTEQYGSSPNVPHSLFMMARCSLERLPSDFWMLPGPAEREQENLQEAMAQLRKLILDYPGSYAAQKGRVLFVQTLKLSCDHEIYVAEYYAGREKPKAVVQRLTRLYADEEEMLNLGLLPPGYALCGRGEDGLQMLADAYRELKDEKGLARVEEMKKLLRKP